MTRRCVPLDRHSVKEIDNIPCNYTLHANDGRMLYTGSSNVCKHRLQSYYEKDSFSAHPTKRRLRKRAKCAMVMYLPIDEARKREKRLKPGLAFNFK